MRALWVLAKGTRLCPWGQDLPQPWGVAEPPGGPVICAKCLQVQIQLILSHEHKTRYIHGIQSPL